MSQLCKLSQLCYHFCRVSKIKIIFLDTPSYPPPIAVPKSLTNKFFQKNWCFCIFSKKNKKLGQVYIGISILVIPDHIDLASFTLFRRGMIMITDSMVFFEAFPNQSLFQTSPKCSSRHTWITQLIKNAAEKN